MQATSPASIRNTKMSSSQEISRSSDRRPSIFIGSSTEGLPVAKVVQLNLEVIAETTIWSQGVFGLSEVAVESLIKIMGSSDFAVIVFTPDDMQKSRGKIILAPRDNLLIELGLSMGMLGRARTFTVYDRTANLKLPTDLAGITAATFQPHRSGNLAAALGAACTKIEIVIRELGFLH